MAICFAHVNVIGQDWRRLAAFYQAVFGCKPVPPERDQQGEWLDKVTGVPRTHIRGVHLRLPGGGATLEVYGYDEVEDRPEIRANTPGFSHIAFRVDDVPSIAQRVLAEGGSEVGEVGHVTVDGVGQLELQYLSDPEGNIIEVQHWT